MSTVSYKNHHLLLQYKQAYSWLGTEQAISTPSSCKEIALTSLRQGFGGTAQSNSPGANPIKLCTP